jgi:hypothetical protein
MEKTMGCDIKGLLQEVPNKGHAFRMEKARRGARTGDKTQSLLTYFLSKNTGTVNVSHHMNCATLGLCKQEATRAASEYSGLRLWLYARHAVRILLSQKFKSFPISADASRVCKEQTLCGTSYLGDKIHGYFTEPLANQSLSDLHYVDLSPARKLIVVVNFKPGLTRNIADWQEALANERATLGRVDCEAAPIADAGEAAEPSAAAGAAAAPMAVGGAVPIADAGGAAAPMLAAVPLDDGVVDGEAVARGRGKGKGTGKRRRGRGAAAEAAAVPEPKPIPKPKPVGVPKPKPKVSTLPYKKSHIATEHYMKALQNQWGPIGLNWGMATPDHPARLPLKSAGLRPALLKAHALGPGPWRERFVCNSATGESHWCCTEGFKTGVRFPLVFDRASDGFALWWKTAKYGLLVMFWADMIHMFTRKDLYTRITIIR